MTGGAVPLVARREIVQRFRGKAWYVSTAVAVIAVLAVGIIARFVNIDQTVRAEVAVTADAPASLSSAIAQIGDAVDVEIDVVPVTDDRAARAALEAGDADVAIIGTTGDATALSAGEVDSTLQAVLQQAWAAATIEAALRDAGVPGDRIGELVGGGALEVTSIDGPGDDGDQLSTFVGMFSSIALFIAVQIYGSYILIGVVEEKSTAVVEVLLARIRARELLIGKVLGIGTVALAQLAIIVAAAVTSLAVSGASIPSAVWGALPTLVIWFVGGFGMYSFLYAMAGAMVSRQEDAQAASMPVTMLLMVVYLSVFVFASDPSLTAATVLSMIPPFAPLVMPLRMASGEASVLQVVVAIAGMAVTTLLVAVYAARIYTNLVLRRGARIGWAEALRSTRP